MTAGDARVDGDEEREVKLAVGAGWALPELAERPGDIAEDRGVSRLRAVYWDTDDLALVRAQVGLRHRDGTWTFKGPARADGDAVVREELERPGDAAVIPDTIRDRLRPLVEVAALHPVAELETDRHRVDVRSGAETVEVVHDSVRVMRDGTAVTSFAEVEVEFPPACAGLARRVTALLVSQGAAVDPTPKYLRALRALGHSVPETR